MISAIAVTYTARRAPESYGRPRIEAFVRIVNGLRPGAAELSCHRVENAKFDSMYRVERWKEM